MKTKSEKLLGVWGTQEQQEREEKYKYVFIAWLSESFLLYKAQQMYKRRKHKVSQVVVGRTSICFRLFASEKAREKHKSHKQALEALKHCGGQVKGLTQP